MASRKDQRDAAREEREAQEQQAAAAARRKRMTQLGVGGFFAAAIVVVVLIVVSQSGGGSDSSGGDASSVADTALVAKQLQGIPQSGNVLGDPNAKVTVVEFGDPQCPVCKEFSEQVVPQFIQDTVRSGDAKYEFKPWVIIGAQSKPASEAALAAGEQDHFFNYLELFYRNQGEENSGYVTDDFMTAIANGAGVPDIDRWNTDRDSSKWSTELAAINTEAEPARALRDPVDPGHRPRRQEGAAGSPNASQLADAVKAAE